MIRVSERLDRQTRSFQTSLTTRSEQEKDEMYIEGYFAVFNNPTELWKGAYEEVSSGAFEKTLTNDIKALINHDTNLVLGRNKANTLELKTDSYGLWGRVKINPKDTDAVNLYERVKRGDVDECSFGFNIIDESTEYRDDGSVKWTLREVDLHEVSIVTFPAYQNTGVQARMSQYNEHLERKREVKKNELRERLNKCLNN